MIALIQRVNFAKVIVDDKTIASIDRGILALVAVEKADDFAQADRLLERIINYRVFADESDRMNLSLQNTNNELLLVPQFTLAADTKKGMRASFTPAACPQQGKKLFSYLVSQSKLHHKKTQSGEFAANMQVESCNDGPVTFWIEAK